MAPASIYYLNHPEVRHQGEDRPGFIGWGGYKFNRISMRLDIKGNGRSITIWNLFRFFSKTFVASLKDWGVGTQEELATIQAMKDKRGDFQGIGKEEQIYCQSECMLLAKLAQELIDAHKKADLKLYSYYGPGSTAQLMLKKMKAKENKAEIPGAMNTPVECAFFGGRFEHSRIGPTYGVWGYDIASAYPFAMTQLPCFKCGVWTIIKRPSLEQIKDSAAACIHYELPPWEGLRLIRERPNHKKYVKGGRAAENPWGPFPFRLDDGNIVFPVVSKGGWVWKPEYLAGIEGFPNVKAKEAWLYNTKCKCEKPFAVMMASYYNARLEWGKEGKGIVMKLGVNSCYGKMAQRVGKPPFQCVVSAGIITATCRGMLLRGMAKAKDPWDIVGLATDGIQVTSELQMDDPPRTGTENKAKEKGKMPLGAWECKGKEDTFLIRPGMRFPMDREKKTGTAARGMGVRVLHENRALVLAEWERNRLGPVKIQQPYMFWGSKSCVRPTSKGMVMIREVIRGERELGSIPIGEFTKDEKYGDWQQPEKRNLVTIRYQNAL